MKLTIYFAENLDINAYKKFFISLSLKKEDIEFNINIEIFKTISAKFLFSTVSHLNCIFNGKKKLISTINNRFLRNNDVSFVEFDYVDDLLKVYVNSNLNKFESPIISTIIPTSGDLETDIKRKNSTFSVVVNPSTFIEDQEGFYWNLYLKKDLKKSAFYLQKLYDSILNFDYQYLNKKDNSLYQNENQNLTKKIKLKNQKINEARNTIKEKNLKLRENIALKNSEFKNYKTELNNQKKNSEYNLKDEKESNRIIKRKQRKENMRQIIEINRSKIMDINLEIENDNKKYNVIFNCIKKLKIYINFAYSKYFNTYLSSFYPLISFFILILYLFILKQNLIFSLIAYVPFLTTIFSKTENIIDRLNKSNYEERIKSYLNTGAAFFKYLNLILPLLVIIPINSFSLSFFLALGVSYFYLFLALYSIRENLISYQDGKIFFRIIYPILMFVLLSEIGFNFVNYSFIGVFLCLIIVIFDIIQELRLKEK